MNDVVVDGSTLNDRSQMISFNCYYYYYYLHYYYSIAVFIVGGRRVCCKRANENRLLAFYCVVGAFCCLRRSHWSPSPIGRRIAAQLKRCCCTKAHLSSKCNAAAPSCKSHWQLVVFGAGVVSFISLYFSIQNFAQKCYCWFGNNGLARVRRSERKKKSPPKVCMICERVRHVFVYLNNCGFFKFAVECLLH